MDAEDSLPAEEEGQSSVITRFASKIGDFLRRSSVAEPVRLNALKAFGQLCTAAIDVPVAFLEGMAVERRAETHARVRLIDMAGEQIAAQLRIESDLPAVAATRFGNRIVRQQVNLNKVAEVAVGELEIDAAAGRLAATSSVPVANPPLDEDWLNHFETEASEKSSEEMQALFGRILAGEVKRPHTFSIKTLRLVSQLDSRTAAIFKRLCSLSVSIVLPDKALLDVRVCALGGSASKNALQSYGLGFSQLNDLAEHGLIISDLDSYLEYGMCISSNARQPIAPFTFGGVRYCLKSKTAHVAVPGFRVHGVALTRAGRELFSIVEIEPNQKYSSALCEFFGKAGFDMVDIDSGT